LDTVLTIYIHWPFCRSKCPYCDFNSYAAADVDHPRWRAALLRELDYFAVETAGRRVGSVFFGGGTPSLMAPETAAELIALIRERRGFSEDVEITLEANPTSVESGRFHAFREAGVNRLSLGLQALDDRALRFLGRGHTAAEALSALDLAKRHFPRVSFDMIYGRPGQTVSSWRSELAEALALAGGHLSLYQLTVEPGTAFQARGVVETDEESGAMLYETTDEMLKAHGFGAYEVSNYARPGEECRHNLACWQGGDYLGIGPGAHGRLTSARGTEALEQIAAPEQWLKMVEETGCGTAHRSVLSPHERRQELLLCGLRLTEGVRRDRFLHLAGIDLEQAVDNNALRRMVEGGFLEIDGKGLRATGAGRLRLNAVLAGLLSG